MLHKELVLKELIKVKIQAKESRTKSMNTTLEQAMEVAKADQ